MNASNLGHFILSHHQGSELVVRISFCLPHNLGQGTLLRRRYAPDITPSIPALREASVSSQDQRQGPSELKKSMAMRSTASGVSGQDKNMVYFSCVSGSPYHQPVQSTVDSCPSSLPTGVLVSLPFYIHINLPLCV